MRTQLGTYWVEGWWHWCRAAAIECAKRIGAKKVYVSFDGLTPSAQVTWEAA